MNTPGTAGGPGGRDRMLALNSKNTLENQLFFVEKIKSTKKKCIFGETNFQPLVFSEVSQKKKKERKLVITMASYALQMPPRVAHTSRLGQKYRFVTNIGYF